MLQVTGLPSSRATELLSDSARLDNALAGRLQQLDSAAWESFYLEHRRLIRGVLAGYLGYSADLEDIAQQVFVTAFNLIWADKVRLEGEKSGLRAWLVAIAVRLAYSERRRRNKVRSLAPPDDAENQTQPPLDPVHAELLQRTRQVLSQLPNRLQTPWLLRHLERMSLDEIAASAGVSLATVKRRLTAADARFRKLATRDCVLREHLRDRGDS
jgi:RNA polymerase sigma-70 factor (ECF subfamily)